MRNLLAGLLLWACCSTAFAHEWRLLELDQMSMEYSEIFNNRDPYFTYQDRIHGGEGEFWLYRVAVNFDLALIKFGPYGLRWRNAVIGDSTNAQFRQVQWQFRWGIQVSPNVEVFYDHRSRHGMELVSDTKYPLENRVGVEVTFYQRKQ